MKKIIIVLAVLISLLGFFDNSYALEETLEIGSVEDLFKKDGGFPDATVHMRVTTTGKYIYCIDSNRGNLYKGHVLTLDEEIKDAGLVYLAANGFPNKTMTGDIKKDYYITQFAIWLYRQEVDGIRFTRLDDFTSGKFENYDITPHIRKLYNGALEAHKNGIPEPSISVNSKSELTLSADGKYIESDYNTVNLNGASEYTINIKNNELGAYAADSNGNPKTTFDSKEKFKILIPVENVSSPKFELEVEINSEAFVNKAYRYKNSNPERQRVLNMEMVATPKNLKAIIKFNYDSKEVDMEFSKQDITSKKELPGATLVIKNSSGKVIDTWVSTIEPHKIKLIPGKYTLTETIAPESYELSTESIEFEVNRDGNVKTVVMYNKLKDKTVVKISKQDITNKQELPGATLVVRNSTGEIIDTWVSTTEPHYLENLEVGKYTITETIAPEGYELKEENVVFEVKHDGFITTVVMYNAPKIEFPKTDLNVSSIVIFLGFMLSFVGVGIIFKKVYN